MTRYKAGRPAGNLIVLGFSVSLLILVFVGVLSYRATARLIEVNRWISESHETFDQVDSLLLEVLEVESATRAYIMGGEDFYLEPYYSAKNKIDQTLQNLQVMTSRNPRLRDSVMAMREPIQQKIDYHKQQIEMRAKLGDRASMDAFTHGTGHELMDKIRGIADQVKDEEKALLTLHESEARLAARQSIYLLAFGSFLAFAIFIFISWNLMREISKRKKTEAVLLHLNRLHLILNRVSQTISRVHESNELLQEAIHVALDQEELKYAWIGLFDEDTGSLAAIQNEDIAERFLNVLPISIGSVSERTTGVAESLLKGRSFKCNNTRTNPDFDGIAADFASFALFPLNMGGKLIGVLCILADKVDYFDVETVFILDQLTSNLSHALEAVEAEVKSREAVEQIKRLNEELELRVKQRTQELAVANSELALRNQEVERANRLKSEFLANMSHELRTPLNAIIGFSDLLAEEKAGPLQTKQKHFVGHISTGAHHLLKLINEVLDISKIEAGRLDLEPENFGAAAALDEVLLVISPLAVNKKIQVDSRVGNDLSVFADRIRFKQILYNLLSNALKFTPELGKTWIEAACEEGGIARFSVGDTGIGIPLEEQRAIFDEFHQVSDTAKAPQEGSGLGLAITRRLVELSGGKIWVESEPEKGSTFHFTLPLTPPLKATKPSPN